MNFNKIVRFLRKISNDPDLGRVAYNHEYTQIYIKISPDIYKLFLYFDRNSDTENNSSLFKTYAVDLRRLLCEQVVCLITGKKKEHTDHFPFSYIFLFILKRKKRNKINK